jgi:hypothetical protein
LLRVDGVIPIPLRRDILLLITNDVPEDLDSFLDIVVAITLQEPD